jgi:2-oxoglutarate ferredoxin oxidoreductase subunit delta
VARIKIDEVVCKGCGLCVRYCPRQVIAMSERINAKGYCVAEPAAADKCTGCTFCALMCPDIAVRVYR